MRTADAGEVLTMKATDFTHDDCLVGSKRRTYATLAREWRCAGCGAPLTTKWSEDYPYNWYIACRGGCDDHDFVHEYEIDRQKAEASEVMDGLPPELLAIVRPAMPVNLSAIRAELVEI